MEKLANNLANYILGKQITRLLFIAFFIGSLNLSAQIDAPINYKTYKIGAIKVTGNTSFSEGTVITYSGLKEGDEITVPTKAGSKIAEAVQKLWKSNLFSSIDIFYTLNGDIADIEIVLIDLPELKDIIQFGLILKSVDNKEAGSFLVDQVQMTYSPEKKPSFVRKYPVEPDFKPDSFTPKTLNLFINDFPPAA